MTGICRASRPPRLSILRAHTHTRAPRCETTTRGQKKITEHIKLKLIFPRTTLLIIFQSAACRCDGIYVCAGDCMLRAGK